MFAVRPVLRWLDANAEGSLLSLSKCNQPIYRVQRFYTSHQKQPTSLFAWILRGEMEILRFSVSVGISRNHLLDEGAPLGSLTYLLVRYIFLKSSIN